MVLRDSSRVDGKRWHWCDCFLASGSNGALEAAQWCPQTLSLCQTHVQQCGAKPTTSTHGASLCVPGVVYGCPFACSLPLYLVVTTCFPASIRPSSFLKQVYSWVISGGPTQLINTEGYSRKETVKPQGFVWETVLHAQTDVLFW